MLMDEREAMAVSGSSSPSFYIHRGGSSVGQHHHHNHHHQQQQQHNIGFNSPPGFRSLMGSALLGQSSSSSNHRNNNNNNAIEPPPVFVDHQHIQGNFPHRSVGTAPSGWPGGLKEPGKKKRGRPRKYGHGGAIVSLGLSPVPVPPVSPSIGSVSPTQRKNRGRPPGSGRKQQLASLGGWMNSSAGAAFAPHVIFIAVGEDIAAKIMAFAIQKPRALCIMSANGKVSSVTIQQPVSGTASRYEGRFEILCLSGSYLVAENGEGGPHKRNGGLNVSLCSPEGHVFGGVVGGMLIASSPVQVVACSFVYGGSKPTEKTDPNAEGSMSLQVDSVKSEANQSPNSMKINRLNTHAGIDLAHG